MNIIKWFNGVSRCQNYILSPLLEEAKHLKLFFNDFSLCHIYMECNSTTDQLSKVGLQQYLGSWRIEGADRDEIRVLDQPPYE